MTKKRRKRFGRILSSIALTVISTQLLSGISAKAETINGKVSWDNSNERAVTGIKDGKPYSHTITPLFVNGKDAFCLQPGVDIISTDYVGNPAGGNIPRETKLAMALWKKVLGTDVNSKLITGTVVWGSLEGSNKFTVNTMQGISDSDLKAKQNKLKDAIKDYDTKPSFNKQKVELTYGVTTEIKNTTPNVDLRDFDKVVGNTAGVTYEVTKDSIKITPKDKTKQKGVLSLKKTAIEGVPYIYAKSGSQTLGIGADDDPTNFLLNFVIKTTGNAKIQKLDEETGKPLAGFKFKVDFEGENAPKSQEIVTDQNGEYEFKDLLVGTKVIATEVEAKEPHILQSAVGNSDTVSGTVEVDKTITLTQKNPKEKGQILIEKKGTESKLEKWNDNYTLTDNIFEIRKDSQDGEVIQTIKTNETGKAETSKDLDLGVYWVTEKQASAGFVNTFKPVKVELTYENQTVPVVFATAKGDNQEVTGKSTLQKVDSETGKETQGKAKFEGAEYTLYHNDENNADTPVKWNEAFKPVLTIGKKVNDESVVIQVDSKNIQVGVEHLALGKYYWKETKNPEGYQIDNKKHYIDIKYAGQDQAVIVSDTESKENVVKINFEAFKYVTSSNGSAQTGRNDIDFTLTPENGTKGEAKKTKTASKDNQDGYFTFNEIPYGDYILTEDKAPDGFKKIKPLIINSSYDSKSKTYIFTVTEKGQKEPLKMVKVLEDKINDGTNIIQMSRFSFFDDSVEVPEIETTLTTDSGKKMFDYGQTVKLKDKVTFSKFDNYSDDEITFNGVLTNNGEPILIDGKEITGTVSSKDKAKGTVTVNFEFDSSKLDISKVQKLTSFITAVDSKGEVIQVHNDPNNEEQTVELNVPKLDTVATYQNDDKEAPSNEKAKAVDKVSYENIAKGDYEVVTKAYDKQSDKFILDQTTAQKALDTTGQWNIKLDINTLDSIGHDIVLYQYVYSDKEHKNLIAKHEDIDSKEQTLKVLVPKVSTVATFKNGEKQANATDKETAFDKLSYENFSEGTYYVETKIVDKGKTEKTEDTKDENTKDENTKDENAKDENADLSQYKVVAESNSVQEVKADKTKGEWSIEQELSTKDLAGHDIVFLQYVYSDEKKTKLVAKHEDINSKEQTLSIVSEETPLIETLAHTGDGKTQIAAPSKETKMYDKINISNLTKDKSYVYKVKLNRVETKDGKEEIKVVYEDSFDLKSEKSDYEKEINTTVDTTKDNNDVRYVFTEQLYDSKNNLVADHSDLKNTKETIIIKTDEETLTKKDLPKAGETIKRSALIIGLIASMGFGVAYYFNNKRNKDTDSNGIDRFE